MRLISGSQGGEKRREETEKWEKSTQVKNTRERKRVETYVDVKRCSQISDCLSFIRVMLRNHTGRNKSCKRHKDQLLHQQEPRQRKLWSNHMTEKLWSNSFHSQFLFKWMSRHSVITFSLWRLYLCSWMQQVHTCSLFVANHSGKCRKSRAARGKKKKKEVQQKENVST